MENENRHFISSLYLNITSMVYNNIMYFFEKKMSEGPLHYLNPVKKGKKELARNAF
jgi:hypothetical protein